MFTVIFFVLCVLLIYRYTTRNHDYWEKRKVKHERPLPLFGNHLKNLLIKRSLSEIGIEMLNKFKEEKIVGYYRGNTPELIINDLEIVKQILSADYKIFPNKGWSGNTKRVPLLQNLIFCNQEEWKFMRQQWNAGFTPSKLGKLSPKFFEWADELIKVIEDGAAQGKVVDAYDLLTASMLQCVGSCGLGIELKPSEWIVFRDLMKKFYIRSKSQQFLLELIDIIPEITCFFNCVQTIDKNLSNTVIAMTKILKDGQMQRSDKSKNFSDIFLDMAGEKKSEYFGDDSEKRSLEHAAAQIFLFLLSGFETSATAISCLLHQLAYHPNIQQEIQRNVDMVLSKHDNNPIKSLDELKLFDMAIKESMRIFSPVGAIRRVCEETYKIPGTDVTIDRGVRILIPIQAFHMDPYIFDDLEEFRPERFASKTESAESKYLVFGEGPKKCIGYKLAMMMVTASVTSILRKYTVLPAPNSKRRIEAEKTSFLGQIVKGGLPLIFIPRK